ncbi:MAG: hypothetical protein ACPG21_04955 [Crocinitomicaceae bacterium]
MKKLNQHTSLFGGMILCAMVFARYMTGSDFSEETDMDQPVSVFVTNTENDLSVSQAAADYTVYQSPFDALGK